MYRILGLFWLIAGIAIITLPWTMPTLADQPMMGNRVGIGAFAFVLSFYNMVRWRMQLARAAAAQAAEEALRSRRRPPAAPIDPEFDFSDPQTKPKE